MPAACHWLSGPRMTAPLDPVVRFSSFELDMRTGELRKSGVRISLPDQPFQLLKTLLDRPGELVTRDELRQRLWSAETFVDFEHGLNAAVRRLRDALGDSAETPRFVETLPRRGYRFIAPLIQEPAADSMPPSASISALQPLAAPAKAASPRRARFVTVAALAATALVAAGLWSGRAAGVSGLSGQRLVTDYRGSHGWGSFSPDGKMIAYTSDADGSDQVWVKNLAAGDPIQLTFGPPGVGRLAWAPAGDQIVFAKAGDGASGRCRRWVVHHAACSSRAIVRSSRVMGAASSSSERVRSGSRTPTAAIRGGSMNRDLRLSRVCRL